MHTVFLVFFFTCSSSLLLQLLALRVLLMMGFQNVVDTAYLMCLSLICCLGVPTSLLLLHLPPSPPPPTFAAYCTHFCFCPVACLTAFSYPHFSSLVFALFSVFFEPIIQYHASSASIFCSFISYSDQVALSAVFYCCS